MDDEVLLSRNYMDFAYRPKRRTPLTSYMRRLSLQYICPDSTVLSRQTVAEIYALSVLYIPFISKHERSINLTTFEKTKLNKSTQTFNSIHNLNQETKRFFYSLSLIILAIIIICSVIIGVIVYVMEKSTMQPIDNHSLILFKFVNNKAVHYNQESDIWNNLPLAINKLISRATRKVSWIILLFASKTTTMNSPAIAYANGTINTDIRLCLNPDIGNDAGEIIDILKRRFPMKKIIICEF